MIKTIIFDYGGVMIDNPTKTMFDYYCRALKTDEASFLKAFLVYKDDWQNGLSLEEEFWNNVRAMLNIDPSIKNPSWIEGFKQAYKEKKRMFQLANTLRRNGIKVGVLSNTEKPIADFISNVHTEHFDQLIFSCYVNISKPDKRAYKHALEKLKASTEETIFVDDRSENIEAAKNLGMHGNVFTDESVLRDSLINLGIDLK